MKPLRINFASQLLSIGDLKHLAGLHGLNPFHLQSAAGAATLSDDGPLLVGELLRLARFGLQVRDEAERTPKRPVVDVVNELTRRTH